MFLRRTLAFAALLPFGTLAQESGQEFTETIEGYTFIKSGPHAEDLAPKIQYEWNSAKTALHLLKSSLGVDGLLKTLKPAIDEADTFWKNIASTSKGKVGEKDGWIDASAQGLCFLPNVTAASFVKWYLSPLADKANEAANPEHYFKVTTVDTSNGSAAATSDILEGWGGITTHFKIPNFQTPPDSKRYPFLHPLTDFPFQAAGDKVLLDGTVFGVLHIAVKDIKGADHGQKINGVEVFSSVWYGDAAKDDHLEEERKHMTTEIINLTLQAQKDIEAGLLA